VYEQDNPGFKSQQRKKSFSSTLPVHLSDPSSLLINESQPILPGLMLPDCDVEHSAPSVAEVKNEWSYISAPRIRLMEQTGKNYLSHRTQNELAENPNPGQRQTPDKIHPLTTSRRNWQTHICCGVRTAYFMGCTSRGKSRWV